MASPEQFSAPEKHEPTFELVAPPGWQKRVASAKKKGTAGRASFVTPDGEEIKSKRALDEYLKKHPGGPASLEFDWGTGETPTRRSVKLSLKPRPSPSSPDGGSGRKRARKAVKEAAKDEELVEVGKATREHPPPGKLETNGTPQEKTEQVVQNEKLPVAPLPDELSAPLSSEKVDDGMQPALEEPKKSNEAKPKMLHEVDATADVIRVQATKEEEKRTDTEVIPAGEKVTNEALREDDKHEDVQNNGAADVVEEISKKEDCDKTSSGYQQCPEEQNARPAPAGVFSLLRMVRRFCNF